jgi:hypothetical protein
MKMRTIMAAVLVALSMPAVPGGDLARLKRPRTKLNFTNPSNDLRVAPEWEKVCSILKTNAVSYPLMICSLTCGVDLFGTDAAISTATNEIARAISKGEIDNSLLRLRITTGFGSGS